MIVGLEGGETGAVLSGDVAYSSGEVYDAMSAAGYDLTGSLSWSLLDISPELVIVGTPGGDRLDTFDSNGTGQFSAVPEPMTLSLLVVGGAGLLARRRR